MRLRESFKLTKRGRVCHGGIKKCAWINFFCAAGSCAFDAAKQKHNVTVVLSAMRNDILPAPETLALSCSTQLDGRVPTSASDSDCAVTAFEVKLQYPCSDTAGGFCLSVQATLSIVSGAVDLISGPSKAGVIIASSLRDSTLIASAQITFKRYPRLISATFSSGYGQVELAFDQPTTAPALPCATLLRWTASLLGVKPGCGWRSLASLIVTLGAAATLVPGDQLVFAATLSDSSGMLVAPLNQSVIVAAPSKPLLPRVTIAGPDSIAACDSASLTASAALAPGGIFEWGCTSDSTIDSLLKNQTKGPTATVPGALLSPNRAYFISVRVQNRFGDVSDVFVRPLTLAMSPSVLPSIILPSPPYSRNLRLQLEADASPSSCAPQTVKIPVFLWSVAVITVTGNNGQQTLQREGAELIIPPGTLSVGHYAITLTIVLPGQVNTASY